MKQRKRQAVLLGLGLLSFFGCGGLERNFLFYPSHHQRDNELKEWKVDGRVIGYSRQVSVPENVWLMLHGNAGQAADRTYALASFSEHDSVFIMEYPGYGARPGKPSKKSFDKAAAQAYRALELHSPRAQYVWWENRLGAGRPARRPSNPHLRIKSF